MSLLKEALSSLSECFDKDDERMEAALGIVKLDGKKKKRPTFICLTVTMNPPVTIRVYFVKSDKDEGMRKKERYHLRDIQQIDGINPKKPTPELHLYINGQKYVIISENADQKNEFVRKLYKLSTQFSIVPDFCNVSLPVDSSDVMTMFFEGPDDHHDKKEYQAITTKEENDFRKLLDKTNLTVANAKLFTDVLLEQLQSLDGANITSMMASENSVSKLIDLFDKALTDVEVLEKELNVCDNILAAVRNSVELIEEKDSLSVVERANKRLVHDELVHYLNALDSVTDEHLEVLRRANLSDTENVNKCTDAANAVSKFWNGRTQKALLHMQSYRDKNDSLEAIDVFVSKLLNHLAVLFGNLNELSFEQGHNDMCIPKQSQRFRALSPFSDLINWLKVNRPKAYTVALHKYTDATNVLYKRLFDNFFDNLVNKVQRAGATPTPASVNRLNSSSMSTRGSDNSSLTSIGTETLDTDTLPNLIETVLGELNIVIDAEQKFVTRFFHINSELLAHFDTTSVSSGDSSLLGGKNVDKLMNEQVRSAMAPLFESLNYHLDNFCRAICRINTSNVLMLFVIMSKSVLKPQDTSSYFAVTFGSLVVLIKRQFDAFMELESQQYSEVKITKRTRIGILPSIERFGKFVERAEIIFKTAERRNDLEKWYSYLCKAIDEGIRNAANHPNSKSPPSVVKFENYHHFYLTLSQLKMSCLDAQRQDAKYLTSEYIDVFVKEYMGRPLEKMQVFFDQLDTKAKTCKPEQISIQFSRSDLKSVISQYPGKEIKKGLEALYKKIEKYLVENSSLLQVVWRNMQEQFLKQLKEYNRMIDIYYPGTNFGLVTTDEILKYFSEIAQQH